MPAIILIAYSIHCKRHLGAWTEGEREDSGQNTDLITERVQVDPGYSSPELLLSVLPPSCAQQELGRADLEAQLLDSEHNYLCLKSVCKKEDQCSIRT